MGEDLSQCEARLDARWYCAFISCAVAKPTYQPLNRLLFTRIETPVCAVAPRQALVCCIMHVRMQANKAAAGSTWSCAYESPDTIRSLTCTAMTR